MAIAAILVDGSSEDETVAVFDRAVLLIFLPSFLALLRASISAALSGFSLLHFSFNSGNSIQHPSE